MLGQVGARPMRAMCPKEVRCSDREEVCTVHYVRFLHTWMCDVMADKQKEVVPKAWDKKRLFQRQMLFRLDGFRACTPRVPEVITPHFPRWSVTPHFPKLSRRIFRFDGLRACTYGSFLPAFGPFHFIFCFFFWSGTVVGRGDQVPGVQHAEAPRGWRLCRALLQLHGAGVYMCCALSCG